MNIPLATRKFQLVQVGSGKVPPLDVQTELSFQTRLVTTETENGGVHDYYASRFTPVGIGTVKYSGYYPLCNALGYPDGELWRNETDMISVARSVWTPFLFYTNLTVQDPKGLTAPDCGGYVWAYGKITGYTSMSSVLDHVNRRSSMSRSIVPRATPFDIVATLRTPLMPVTYSRWRYGVSQPLPVGRTQMLDDLEIANAEQPSMWYCPCEMTSIYDGERFWPRNLYNENFNTGGIQFDAAKWECSYVRLSGAASELMSASGNTQPRTRMVATGDAYFTIRNNLGTFVYNYGRPQTSAIYADSQTGVTIERDIDGNLAPVPGAAWPPQLTWGDNIVSSVNGVITIGAMEAWIN